MGRLDSCCPSKRKWSTTLALLFGLALTAPSARAQSNNEDVATARALGKQGLTALEHKDYAAAADLFVRADALRHAATLTLGYARAQAGLGKLVAAHETYQRIVREGVPASESSSAIARAVDDAKREKSELEARLPTVTISVAGPSAPLVTIDGSAVPAAALGVKRFVDPGSHVVRASADGYVAAETPFTVAEGGMANVPITLQRDLASPPLGTTGAPRATASQPDATTPSSEAAPRASSPLRALGLTALGAGIGALGMGVGLGASALHDDRSLSDACNAQGQCNHDLLTRVDGYMRIRMLSFVALGTGVGLVGLGGGLTFATRSQPSDGTRRSAGWAFVGAGVGAGAFAAVAASLSASASSDAGGCTASCTPLQDGARSSASELRTAAIAGAAVAAVALVSGVVLVATDKPATAKRGDAATQIRISAGPSGVGAIGTFF